MSEPDMWEHITGYHLNADGKAIKYRHRDTGYVAHIEAMLNEQEGEMEYRPAIFDGNGTMVEYPRVFYVKDRAKAELDRLKEEHS